MAGLEILRGADFAATSAVPGVLIFRSFIARRSDGCSGLEHLGRLLALLAALLSGAWALGAAADLGDSWKPAELWQILGGTDFGRLWLAKCASAAFLLIALLRKWRGLALGLGLVSLAAFSLTGHPAAKESGFALAFLNDWAHLIAVSSWWGGLLALLVWLSPASIAKLSDSELEQGVRGFSRIALAATGIIFVTGLFSGLSAGVSGLNWLSSGYSLLFVSKAVVFAGVLAAASLNHFKHLPAWGSIPARDSARRVRRAVRLEAGGVLILFVLAGFLSRSAPPVN
ncbi:MAG: CopD family protein [Oligoflexia bacterium]|nr:CopD family protein [Oligoflexia bacterium]